MWGLALICDGCHDPVAWVEVPHRGLRLRWAGRDLGAEARRLGWEVVDAPDGREWYCPTCRRARDGRALCEQAAAAAGVR